MFCGSMLALADLGTIPSERADFAEGATAGILDKAVGHCGSAGVSIGTVVSFRGPTAALRHLREGAARPHAESSSWTGTTTSRIQGVFL
jgi:hypothetical protein